MREHGGSMKPKLLRPKVLVVDDHAANRLAMEVVLERDFTVCLADSGHLALELTEGEDFAVILLDVRMPVMDGYQAAAELRRRDKTRMVPILFTSALETKIPEFGQGIQGGATDYVLTPFDPEYLIFKVRTYAEAHLRRQTLETQVDRLNDTLRDLRAELARTTPHDAAVDAQVRNLEASSQRLRQRGEEQTRTQDHPPSQK